MESMLLPILMFAALGALMYFSMKKQKRQAAQVKQMQDSLIPGSRVMTTSGLHGTITAVADDTIELEVAPGMRTTWVRAAVREVVVPAPVEDSYDDSLRDDTAPEIVDADPDTSSNNGGINFRKSNEN
jgi:preprotein translocase subunit YajC